MAKRIKSATTKAHFLCEHYIKLRKLKQYCAICKQIWHHSDGGSWVRLSHKFLIEEHVSKFTNPGEGEEATVLSQVVAELLDNSIDGVISLQIIILFFFFTFSSSVL